MKRLIPLACLLMGFAPAGTQAVIDASSAHRVSPGLVYGFPEMAEPQRRLIR